MVIMSGSVVLPTDDTSSQDGPFKNARDYMKVIKGSNQECVLSDIQQGKSGHMVFDINGIRWHCHYNPVGYGGWYIFTLLRHDIGTAYATEITSRLAASSGLVLICLLVCGLLIMRQQRRYIDVYKRQMERFGLLAVKESKFIVLFLLNCSFSAAWAFPSACCQVCYLQREF